MPSQFSQMVDNESDDWDVNELSGDQIKVLLRQAEQRLRTSQPSNEHVEARAPQRLIKLNPGAIVQPYISSTDGVARTDPRRLLNDEDRRLSNLVRTVEDPVKVKEKAKKRKSANAGPAFFFMPRTQLTTELKTDLQLLKVRAVLDPSRHYKKDSRNLVPYSEVGRIIEGPTHLSSRTPKREQKGTFVEEVLANERSTGRFKNKYNEIQSSRTSGKRANYKKLMAKRSGGIRKP